MKLIIYTFTFLYAFTITAQDCDIPTNKVGKFEIYEVVEVGDYTQEEIFNAVILSTADFVRNPSELIKYQDREAGVLIWELETKVKTTIGGGNFFFFNIKMEMKDGKYRITSNYSDCLFVISDDTSCRCTTDIAAFNCLPEGCILVKDKKWGLLKCTAVDQLYTELYNYTKTIEANLSKTDW